MGRIAKWGTKLGSFDVRYKTRNTIKGKCWLILWLNLRQLSEIHIGFAKFQFRHGGYVWMGHLTPRDLE